MRVGDMKSNLEARQRALFVFTNDVNCVCDYYEAFYHA